MTINTATASVAAPAEMTETQKIRFWSNVKLVEFSMEVAGDDEHVIATLRFPPFLGRKFAHQVAEYFGYRIWVIGLTEKTYQNSTFATLRFAITEGHESLLLWLHSKCKKRSFPNGNYGFQQLAKRLNSQTDIIASALAKVEAAEEDAYNILSDEYGM